MKFLGKEWISHLRTKAGDTVRTCRSKSKVETSAIGLARPSEEICQCRLSTSTCETSRIYVNMRRWLWTKLTVNASGPACEGVKWDSGDLGMTEMWPFRNPSCCCLCCIIGSWDLFLYRIGSTVNHNCLPFFGKNIVFFS